MKILVLGATGMLGHELFKSCIKRNIDVHGLVRKKEKLLKIFGDRCKESLHVVKDVKEEYSIERVVSAVRPDFMINCIGVVKQSHLANDYYESVAVNSLLPHRLQRISDMYESRLLHISTDCVFSGKKGAYIETDQPDAYDLYGRSKLLGEVGYGSAVTLRTSIIGHEITEKTHGILEWFLAQKIYVKGYTRAVFSGLTTLELSNIILDVVISQSLPPNIYHIASFPITKYDLLKTIADVYSHRITIEPSDQLILDRSLDGGHFAKLTGYKAPNWKDQIMKMKVNYEEGFIR